MSLVQEHDLADAGSISFSRQLPSWIKVRYNGEKFQDTVTVLRDLGLNTICDEGLCPNKSECFRHGVATFMLLGKVCTRNCRYCHVAVGRPSVIDPLEPLRVALAVQRLGLKYVVITSVNRDDLVDQGAGVFVETARQIKQLVPVCDIEFLIPDFKAESDLLRQVVNSSAVVIGHNIETVQRLFHSLRPQGNYDRSLKVLRDLKTIRSSLKTKSGLMLGLGEHDEEIYQTLKDLRSVGCNFLTLGQYLRPAAGYALVTKYYTPKEFLRWKELAEALGFEHVESGPLVRSSYRADKLSAKL